MLWFRLESQSNMQGLLKNWGDVGSKSQGQGGDKLRGMGLWGQEVTGLCG